MSNREMQDHNSLLVAIKYNIIGLATKSLISK